MVLTQAEEMSVFAKVQQPMEQISTLRLPTKKSQKLKKTIKRMEIFTKRKKLNEGSSEES